MKPVGENLAGLLGKTVPVLKDYLDGQFDLNEGELVLFENVRFNKGEGKDNEELSRYAPTM